MTKEKIDKRTDIKRLYFDLETSPNIVYSWNVGYKLNISYENIIRERSIICICYKWEGDDKVYSLKWENGDDRNMVYQFYNIVLRADELIGHNGDQYDLRWFRTRCLFHGISNFPEIKSIDTLKVSRNKFRFNSNRLDYIGQFLSLGKKTHTDFSLWKDITMNNDKKALKQMVDYCCNDVLLLEKVYKKLEGYTKHKTHAGLLKGKGKCSCPGCASTNTTVSKSIISAMGIEKKQMKCNNCGRYFTISKSAYEESAK